MRTFAIGLLVLASVNLLASPGMPKTARFLLNPAEAATVVQFDELDLSSFKVSKCINQSDIHTGALTSSWGGFTYSGPAFVINVGQQQYEMLASTGTMAFEKPGCALEMKNIQAFRLGFQNKNLPESRIEVLFSFDSKSKGVAGISSSGVIYRGAVLSSY